MKKSKKTVRRTKAHPVKLERVVSGQNIPTSDGELKVALEIIMAWEELVGIAKKLCIVQEHQDMQIDEITKLALRKLIKKSDKARWKKLNKDIEKYNTEKIVEELRRALKRWDEVLSR